MNFSLLVLLFSLVGASTAENSDKQNKTLIDYSLEAAAVVSVAFPDAVRASCQKEATDIEDSLAMLGILGDEPGPNRNLRAGRNLCLMPDLCIRSFGCPSSGHPYCSSFLCKGCGERRLAEETKQEVPEELPAGRNLCLMPDLCIRSFGCPNSGHPYCSSFLCKGCGERRLAEETKQEVPEELPADRNLCLMPDLCIRSFGCPSSGHLYCSSFLCEGCGERRLAEETNHEGGLLDGEAIKKCMKDVEFVKGRLQNTECNKSLMEEAEFYCAAFDHLAGFKMMDM